MRKLAAALALVLLPVPAAAADGDAPRLEGELSFELQNDRTYAAEAPGGELNDLSTTIEAELALVLGRGFSIESHLTLEEQSESEPFHDHPIQDLGAYVEALTLNYRAETWHLFAGKFAPSFSLAYDLAPGIYGADLTEDVELVERLGFGGGYGLDGGPLGRLELSASAFLLDTTVLSESALTNRGRTHRTDGGPSNTGQPTSFALALDGSEVPGLDGLGYRLSFARQAVERAFDEDGDPVAHAAEYGLALTVEWAIALGEELTLTPLAEVVHLWNAQGMRGVDGDIVTLAAALDYQGWNLALAYSGRFRDAGADDWLFQLSLGYRFSFGLEAAAGWLAFDEAGERSETFGLWAGYTVAF